MRNRLKWIVILFVPVIMLLNSSLRAYPEVVERQYSNSVNRVVRQTLSRITSPFLFSIAEILVPGLIITLLACLILLLVKIKKGGFSNQLLNIAVYLSVLYILFMLLWGFNYNRLSFDKIAGLKIEDSSEKQLYGLCEELIERANLLREKVKEDSKGIMVTQGGYKKVFKEAVNGYEKAARSYPELGGSYGLPKPVFLSKVMCYLGITGIYMPYTAEANVNVNIEDFMIPCTVAHEMAHQRGFAREDEANYIAYLTCGMNPNIDFQYSGVMLATIYSMNALAEKDRESFIVLNSKYSEGVKKDLQNQREFWARYDGRAQKISDNVNDSYLKSNGQKDGTESYGRMVDLLLAEFKASKKK